VSKTTLCCYEEGQCHAATLTGARAVIARSLIPADRAGERGVLCAVNAGAFGHLPPP
jgi:hypothetical protein